MGLNFNPINGANDIKGAINFAKDAASDFKGAMNGAKNVGSSPTPGISSQLQSNTELYNTSGPNANEPSLSDIHQAGYGDCYFLASVGALDQHDPNAVKNMIHDNGDGTYTVTFHVQNNGIHNGWGVFGDSYTTKQVTVSASEISAKGANVDWNTVTDSNNGKLVIWPAVVEAAYAKMHDTKIFGHDFGINSGYNNIGNGGNPQPVLENLTGQDAKSYSPSGAELNNLQSQFDSGKLITVCTPESDGTQDGYNRKKYGNPYGLIGDHVYTVTNVYIGSNGQEYVTLNNPWGFDQPRDIPLSDLPRVINGIEVGIA